MTDLLDLIAEAEHTKARSSERCLGCDRKPFFSTHMCRRCGAAPGEWGLPASIWTRIDRPENPTECWNWTGRQMHNGYGEAQVFNGKQEPIHRIVYKARHDVTLTYHEQLDHLCRNRQCVNPDHLEVVDNRTNVTRGLKSALRVGKSSRFVGVYRKGNRWASAIRDRGKIYQLGGFATEEEAAAAYQAALAALTPAGRAALTEAGA